MNFLHWIKINLFKKKTIPEREEIDLRDDVDKYIDDNYIEPPDQSGIDPFLTDNYYTKEEIKKSSEECVNELLGGKNVNFADYYSNTGLIMEIVLLECKKFGLNIKIYPGLGIGGGYYIERL